MKKHGKLLDVLHDTAQGLHEAGVMDAVTMREFDALCLGVCTEMGAGTKASERNVIETIESG